MKTHEGFESVDSEEFSQEWVTDALLQVAGALCLIAAGVCFVLAWMAYR